MCILVYSALILLTDMIKQQVHLKMVSVHTHVYIDQMQMLEMLTVYMYVHVIN